MVEANDPPPELALRLEPAGPLATVIIPRMVIEQVVGTGEGSAYRRWGRQRMVISRHRTTVLTFELAEDCELIGAHVDGAPVQLAGRQGRRFRLPLPTADRPCSAEIEYVATGPSLGAWDRVILSAPRLEESAVVGTTQWLVLAGPDRWFVGGRSVPSWSAARENAQQWLGAEDPSLGWSQHAGRSSQPADDHAQHAGRSSLPADDHAEGVCWTFQTWANAHSLDVFCVRQSFWILVWSGLTLAVGLAAFQVGRAARVRLAAGVLVCLVLAAALWPAGIPWVGRGAQWGLYLLLVIGAARLVPAARRARRVRRVLRRRAAAGKPNLDWWLRITGLRSPRPLPVDAGTTVDYHQAQRSGGAS